MTLCALWGKKRLYEISNAKLSICPDLQNPKNNANIKIVNKKRVPWKVLPKSPILQDDPILCSYICSCHDINIIDLNCQNYYQFQITASSQVRDNDSTETVTNCENNNKRYKEISIASPFSVAHVIEQVHHQHRSNAQV